MYNMYNIYATSSTSISSGWAYWYDETALAGRTVLPHLNNLHQSHDEGHSAAHAVDE
jgi:hypothetical protein